MPEQPIQHRLRTLATRAVVVAGVARLDRSDLELLEAREMARAQDLPAARAAIAQGRAVIEEAKSAKVAVLAQRPADFVRPVRYKYLIDGGGDKWGNHSLDMAALRERLESTHAELPQLARPFPDDVVEALARDRVVRAARIEEEIEIDGGGDDPAWEKAWPVETFFVRSETDRDDISAPARAHTRVRLLHDDAYLYALLEAWFTEAGPPADADKEAMEILIQPSASLVGPLPGVARGRRHPHCGRVRCRRVRPLDPVRRTVADRRRARRHVSSSSVMAGRSGARSQGSWPVRLRSPPPHDPTKTGAGIRLWSAREPCALILSRASTVSRQRRNADSL